MPVPIVFRGDLMGHIFLEVFQEDQGNKPREEFSRGKRSPARGGKKDPRCSFKLQEKTEINRTTFSLTISIEDDAVRVSDVLASPPWSMKVLNRLEDVTQKNVTDVMAYAALCGSHGVPTTR